MKVCVVASDHTSSVDLPSTDLDGPNTLVMIFASPRVDVAGPIRDLRARLPRAVFVGCSTAGEIRQTQVCDDSIVATIVTFEHTRLRRASAIVPDERASYAAGCEIAESLADPQLRGVIVLSEGIAVNGSELARGINQRLGPDVVVTGGLAGDGERFGTTWVLHEDAPTQRRVTAVGLYGDRIKIGHGSRGGWDIFGPERVVTRSEGNVLYELDGKPALALYKEYLGNLARELPGTALLFPLALLFDGDRRLVRTVLTIDEERQSMRFAGDIPLGQRTQLMRANVERLVQGASEAASLARCAADQQVLSLAISCVGRRLVLKGRVEEELEATLEGLPPQTHQVGFYSYGELSSTFPGTCELHNQTMTMTTFYEAA